MKPSRPDKRRSPSEPRRPATGHHQQCTRQNKNRGSTAQVCQPTRGGNITFPAYKTTKGVERGNQPLNGTWSGVVVANGVRDGREVGLIIRACRCISAEAAEALEGTGDESLSLINRRRGSTKARPLVTQHQNALSRWPVGASPEGQEANRDVTLGIVIQSNSKKKKKTTIRQLPCCDALSLAAHCFVMLPTRLQPTRS